MCSTKKLKADADFLICRGITKALKGHPLSVNPSTALLPSVSLLMVFAQKNLTCLVEILQACFKKNKIK